MFEKYFIIEVEDLFYSLDEMHWIDREGAIKEYNDGRTKLYLLSNLRYVKCKRKHLQAIIDNFISKEKLKGNYVAIRTILRTSERVISKLNIKEICNEA